MDSLPALGRHPANGRHEPQGTHVQAHGIRVDLAGRRVRAVEGRDRARAGPRRAIRVGGVRGRALLFDAEGAGGVPPAGALQAHVQLLQDLPDGREVHAGRTGRGNARTGAPERTRRVLHPADGPSRVRRRGHGAVRQPGRSVPALLAVGRLSGRRRARTGGRCLRRELAPSGAEYHPGDREDCGQLPQRTAHQDGGARQRLCRGDRARA